MTHVIADFDTTTVESVEVEKGAERYLSDLNKEKWTGPAIIQVLDEERAANSWPRFVDDEWFELSEGLIDLVDGTDEIGRTPAQIVADAAFDSEAPARLVTFDELGITEDVVLAAS